MNAFEYVSVLYSIVVTLAITHLLSGIGRIIQAPRVRFSLIHAAWVAYILFQCVDFWFSLWQARSGMIWTVALALFVFATVGALYLTSWLVMPEIRSHEPLDLVAFNDANRRKYLVAFIVYSALGAVSILATSGVRSGFWVPLLGVACAAAAWAWRDRRVQALMLALVYSVTGYYALRYIWAL